jgi:hypothetical protein
MHPRDFEVNRTWLAYRMNRVPFITPEGEFDVFVLQDAGSMFIFGSAFASHDAHCPPTEDVASLFGQAWSRVQGWPEELILPGNPSSKNNFVVTAREHGITVKAVAEARMSFYIKDVQSSFEEHSAQSRKAGKGT